MGKWASGSVNLLTPLSHWPIDTFEPLTHWPTDATDPTDFRVAFIKEAFRTSFTKINVSKQSAR